MRGGQYFIEECGSIEEDDDENEDEVRARSAVKSDTIALNMKAIRPRWTSRPKL